MANWEPRRLTPEDVPEHVGRAVERIVRSEEHIFHGTTDDGAHVTVMRARVPSPDLAVAKGALASLPKNASDDQIAEVLPEAYAWFVFWRGSVAHEWPDDSHPMVLSKAQLGKARQQTWMFMEDAGAAVKLCADLWGFNVTLSPQHGAN
jgi:hypothetical protein